MNKQSMWALGCVMGSCAGMKFTLDIAMDHDAVRFIWHFFLFFIAILIAAVIWQKFDPPTGKESKCE